MAESLELCNDLWSATSVGDITWVDSILRRNTNDKHRLVDAVNRGGWTCLMYSAYYGHSDILNTLLREHADVNCRNRRQQTSLMLASMCGNQTCCQTLLERRARVDDRDETGRTALVYAVGSGYPSVVQLLLTNGADVNVVISENRLTPLLLSAMLGHDQIAAILIESGANLTSRTSCNKTAAILATENGHSHMIGLFDKQHKQLNTVAIETKIIVSPLELKHPFPETLTDLLTILGLGQYEQLLTNHNVINLEQFLKLTESNLKEMGVVKLGPRRKMTSAIARINSVAVTTKNAPCKDDLMVATVIKPLIETHSKSHKLKTQFDLLSVSIGQHANLKETQRLVEDLEAELRVILNSLMKIVQQK